MEIKPEIRQRSLEIIDRIVRESGIPGVGDHNNLVSSYLADPKGFDCTRFGDLDAAMSHYRDAALVGGLGSRSTPNLTYRALRRLNVSIPDMVDTLEDECGFAHESIG